MFPQRHRFLGILILFPEWFLSIFLGEESIDKFTTWIRWSTFRTWVFCWRVLPIEEKFFTNWGWGSFPLFEPPFHSWKNPCQLKIYDLAFAAWPSQKHFWISFKITNSGINALLYQKREVQQFSSPSHIFTSGEQETWGAIDPPTELSCTTTRSKKKKRGFFQKSTSRIFQKSPKIWSFTVFLVMSPTSNANKRWTSQPSLSLNKNPCCSGTTKTPGNLAQDLATPVAQQAALSLRPWNITTRLLWGQRKFVPAVGWLDWMGEKRWGMEVELNMEKNGIPNGKWSLSLSLCVSCVRMNHFRFYWPCIHGILQLHIMTTMLLWKHQVSEQ